MSLPSVLIRISTGEVIKHSNYPVADMSEAQGLDSDFKWLIKRKIEGKRRNGLSYYSCYLFTPLML